MPALENDLREWLETDGWGGFASGTVCGKRTRRYHALLLTATRPPAGRIVLVNGFDAWVQTSRGTFAISTQQYAGDTTWPNGDRSLIDFTNDPWPTWTFAVTDDVTIVQEVWVPQLVAGTAVRWTVRDRHGMVRDGDDIWLHVRPLLSGRDYHTLHHQNPQFRFEPLDAEPVSPTEPGVRWQPYPDVPPICVQSNAVYTHQPQWYRNFFYEQEHQRGLDHSEDLASPGEFHWNLSQGDAVWLLGAGQHLSQLVNTPQASPNEVIDVLARRERERRLAMSPLQRSASVYFAKRQQGATIIAGFPWFTDWGRDTFIALRGLALHGDRLATARQILLAWAPTVRDGMLPNRFPDAGDQPEYNSVDASLWFIIAVGAYMRAMQRDGLEIPAQDRQVLQRAIEQILNGYANGTRYDIRVDADGLLVAGVPGVQLTWMDAKVDHWVVTPRIGKPVEVQALWLNALAIAAEMPECRLRVDRGGAGDRLQAGDDWSALLQRGRRSFVQRFWDVASGSLLDVVDVDHVPGQVDRSLRPNQIFAVGGLPLQLLDPAQAASVVKTVHARLWTPLGLRSLDPADDRYQPRYQGGVWQRDGAYHQGTVWTWLIGPFVEAWVRVRGADDEAKRTAAEQFLAPLHAHLQQVGWGHLAEIADADPPHTPRGCPFQAWSLGELMRLENDVLATTT